MSADTIVLAVGSKPTIETFVKKLECWYPRPISLEIALNLGAFWKLLRKGSTLGEG